MNADVEKAVERVSRSLHVNCMPSAGVHVDLDDIRQALRDQEAEIERLREVANLIPKNWLDPMLTGPSAVLKGYDYKRPDIERLLNAIRARITAHLGATP